MKLRTTIVLVVVCLLALPLIAADKPSPMKPGKWELTVQADMPGMSMPPRTFTRCVTKEEAENAEKTLPKMRNESDCKMTDVNVDGKTVTWKVACEKQQMTGEGKITYEGDTYTGEMHMKMPEHEMSMKYSGKRVGECDK